MDDTRGFGSSIIQHNPIPAKDPRPFLGGYVPTHPPVPEGIGKLLTPTAAPTPAPDQLRVCLIDVLAAMAGGDRAEISRACAAAGKALYPTA